MYGWKPKHLERAMMDAHGIAKYAYMYIQLMHKPVYG